MCTHYSLIFFNEVLVKVHDNFFLIGEIQVIPIMIGIEIVEGELKRL